MKMKNKFLGIDLGTSAIKLLLVTSAGSTLRSKCAYESKDAAGWCDALKKAVAQLKKEDDLQDLQGIALSSQVGTYLLDTGDVISWESNVGKAELQEIKAAVSEKTWVEEIGMVHPDLISYPLPRLLYIKRHFPSCKAVMMPKELLLKELTGNLVSDPFSWRGLCHPDKGRYAEKLLKQFGIHISLPAIGAPTDRAGKVTATAASKYGLPENVPVYIGCNDFFAGLLGMGVWQENSLFELSGTSEHLGIITRERRDGAFISGRFFNGFATYGGTKSSGVSCDFAMKQFGIDDVTPEMALENPPIFLPYLKGERAPIYDENARGVFFGITDKTSPEAMAYAVLEGVVFSLYHIGQSLSLPKVARMITGGGSAVNTTMAKLKAALFDCPVFRVTENDSSALGAAMLAMVGQGAFATLEGAIAKVVSYELAAQPEERLKTLLQKRFSVYKMLYVNLKESFEKFSKL